ncbi:carboxymuconolactone decarboxylase family protein [Aliamphritea ceti]|uniref:carboxymuconolactone decarboxylase family protein n=1 Tax=Aliamphritea ceti TaxID=1524258 RepID=UPI0021C277F5|nr:carboxymuconolactone decarboxylase family protein [Aliamphritea ceti]
MSRLNIQKVQPDAYQAMFGLENYLADSSLTADLQELIRLRASLINRCHFCINMHTTAAQKIGIDKDKIEALNNWKNSTVFSNREHAAFAITDMLTNVAVQGLPDEVYAAAEMEFTETELAQLIMLIATINAWNRLGISMAAS